MHDAFVRIAEKLNGLVEQRLLMQLNTPVGVGLGRAEPVVIFNSTQASIVLDLYYHPEGPNTTARIARRLNLESSRISHQLKSLKQQGYVKECPGTGKLPVLSLTRKAEAVAQGAYAAKRYLENQLRKGRAKEFDLFKKVFLPAFEEKIASLVKPKPRRSQAGPKVLTGAKEI